MHWAQSPRYRQSSSPRHTALGSPFLLLSPQLFSQVLELFPTHFCPLLSTGGTASSGPAQIFQYSSLSLGLLKEMQTQDPLPVNCTKKVWTSPHKKRHLIFGDGKVVQVIVQLEFLRVRSRWVGLDEMRIHKIKKIVLMIMAFIEQVPSPILRAFYMLFNLHNPLSEILLLYSFFR